ncbi:hypothetical protein [Xanthobacter autotrophicus]|uniref:hypothetical protein n=1 Tax=Xanthobacter autotrophicus TaxID=280 RepID=UPI00372C0795
MFDAHAHGACPTCGWTEKEAAPASSPEENSGRKKQATPLPPEPNPTRRLLVLAAASAGVVAATAGAYGFLSRCGGPLGTDCLPPPPPAPEPRQQAEAKSAAKSEPKPEPKADPKPEPKAEPEARPETGPPRFADLEPLEQSEQLAVARALGLSAFLTQMVLMARAIHLSRANPKDLTAKRYLVPFVSANQPLALSEAGSAAHYGNAVRQDDAAAREYLKRAADFGVVSARVELAEMLLAGQGGPRDEKAAGDLLVLAARAGSEHALNLLSTIGRGRGSEPTASDLDGPVNQRNWSQVKPIATNLADAQIAQGYNAMGLWSRFGPNRSAAEEQQWYRKAVALGLPISMRNMAWDETHPTSGGANFVEAIAWRQLERLYVVERGSANAIGLAIWDQSGFLDRSQWSKLRTLFAGIDIAGPKGA